MDAQQLNRDQVLAVVGDLELERRALLLHVHRLELRVAELEAALEQRREEGAVESKA